MRAEALLLSDTQRIGDGIDIQYSTIYTQEGSSGDATDYLIVEEWLDGWRCDHYPILNKLATGANALTSSLRHTQSKRLPEVFPPTNRQQIQDTIAVGSTLTEALVC